MWPELLIGDVRAVLKTLPDESVHCVVTSPPYWSLRDYGAAGQIGLEDSPDAHVAVLLEVFREVWRVLRKDGTLWLNYGDCYASAWPCQHRNVIGNGSLENGKREARPPRLPAGLKDKDLVGMPWRVAFALQADGWYLRSDIIWAKPNPMPESVTDRPTRSHEYLFLLAKAERYFIDMDAIREPAEERDFTTWSQRKERGEPLRRGDPAQSGHATTTASLATRTGRNKRTVWEIATQPTPEAHFATFPEALVEPCILAGTSERGCCPECGAPWRRTIQQRHTGRTQKMTDGWDTGDGGHGTIHRNGRQKGEAGKPVLEKVTTGWQPTCTHAHTDADTVPAVVLDPFAGSGTVGRVATRLGRRSILIELNEGYIDIVRKRTAQGGLAI